MSRPRPSPSLAVAGINAIMQANKTIAALFICFLIGAVSSNEAREYCQWEIFNATCPDDHVILLHEAHYGRMRLGRCLTTDVYIGCSADVLPQLDSRCSGKQSCEIALPDSSLHQRQPCPRDMMAYLEAGYTCVKVQSSAQQQCLPGSAPIKVQDPAGLLASHVTQTSGQGSTDCPWRIDVKPGQRVNVYLLDFTLTSRQGSEAPYSIESGVHGPAEFCHVYAIIKEDHAREFTVCAGAEREKLVYTSHTSHVEIQMMHHGGGAENLITFMLKYQAVGCPDLTPPSGAFVARNGDKATVSCNNTSQAWHLVCKDTTWIGDAQQCSPEAIRTDEKEDEAMLPSYGLFIAVGIGVVIGVCCGFTMLGTVLWCRRQGDRRKRRRQQEAHLMPAPAQADTMTLHQCKVHRLKDGCGYTHVWEVQGRNQTGTTSLSPDSAYQTYQGHLSLASAEPAVLYHKREGLYETPAADEGGQKIPFYHEFEAENQNHSNTCRTLCKNELAHAHGRGPCHVHVPVEPPPDLISDDTDEEDRCRFMKPSGYTLVPDSPEKTTRSRSENHYT